MIVQSNLKYYCCFTDSNWIELNVWVLKHDWITSLGCNEVQHDRSKGSAHDGLNWHHVGGRRTFSGWGRFRIQSICLLKSLNSTWQWQKKRYTSESCFSMYWIFSLPCWRYSTVQVCNDLYFWVSLLRINKIIQEICISHIYMCIKIEPKGFYRQRAMWSPFGSSTSWTLFVQLSDFFF